MQKMNNDKWFNYCFSNSVLNTITNSNNYKILNKNNHSVNLKSNNSLFENYQLIYQYMSKNHRNEYFYKNELFCEYILPNLQNKTIGALKEWPLSKCICDFITLDQANQSIVWEIKSDIDSLKRLNNQISNYYHVFDQVAVLTNSQYANKVIQLVPKETGIFELNDENKIDCIRIPKSKYDLLKPYDIYNMWHKNERLTLTKLEMPYYNSLHDSHLNQAYVTRACEKQDITTTLRLTNQFLIDRINAKNELLSDKLKKVPRILKSWLYFNSNKDRVLNNWLNK